MNSKEIDAFIMKCPYFGGKNSINRTTYRTHVGDCRLEYNYNSICPSSECVCAKRLGFDKSKSSESECVTGGKYGGDIFEGSV